MKTILIENTKGIQTLTFNFPNTCGVYLIAGTNGAGKTTLLTCIEKICNPLAFATGFVNSSAWNRIDQYLGASITYSITEENICVKFSKKEKRWMPSPKKGSRDLLQRFLFSDAIFIHADAGRIEVNQGDLQAGNFVDVEDEIKLTLNSLLETEKYSRLKRLRNPQGRGKQAKYYYVIDTGRMYYSEKRFSTGELALLRLVERLQNIAPNTVVLLDEAEMALHPRVQRRLIDYLNRMSRDKNITVFVSTHSPTMIKATPKEKIILLRDMSGGEIEVVTPCYPAEALGCVDLEETAIFDYVFFVEDDIARTTLKKFLDRFISLVPAHATALTCIIPVGGFAQTAEMAVNTRQQILSQSKVFAIVDQDAFDDLDHKPVFKKLYNDYPETIKGFGFTPENWLVNLIEDATPELLQAFRNRFNANIRTIVESEPYRSCISPAPRKLAKSKFSVICDDLKLRTGDCHQIIVDDLIQIIVQSITEGEIMRTVAPLVGR